jgi:hypothetical protein
MKLKDFMELHAEKFNYEIHLKRIDRDFGEPIHLDYADNMDSPWQRYFQEYFNYEVSFFRIETINDFIGPKTILAVYIMF